MFKRHFNFNQYFYIFSALAILIAKKFHLFKIGEPEPIDYTNEVAASHVSLFDARNVAFRGCFCTEGDAIGVVIRIGKYTVQIFLQLFINTKLIYHFIQFRCLEILHICNRQFGQRKVCCRKKWRSLYNLFPSSHFQWVLWSFWLVVRLLDSKIFSIILWQDFLSSCNFHHSNTNGNFELNVIELNCMWSCNNMNRFISFKKFHSIKLSEGIFFRYHFCISWKLQ